MLDGQADALRVRIGDSRGLARGATGADGAPVHDAIAANLLGGEQRFALRFAPDGGPLQEMTLRGYVFRRMP